MTTISNLSLNSDTHNINEALQNACADVGITYKSINYDGKWYRTSTTDGKDDAGTIKVFSDRHGGLAKNWKTGELVEFFVKPNGNVSHAEKEISTQKIKEAIQARKAREAKQARVASETAARLLTQAKAVASHPYLSSHGIQPHPSIKTIHSRDIGQILRGKSGVLSGELLLIPITRDNAIVSLEFIDSSGNKAVLPGSSKKGGHWLSKEFDGHGWVVVTEAAAKALAVTEATGLPAVGTFGNMRDAALTLKKQWPAATFIIAGDAGNGEREAKTLAQEISAPCVIPQFKDGRPKGDWNDVLISAGKETLRNQINAAISPIPQPLQLPPPSPDIAASKPSPSVSDNWKLELTVKTDKSGKKSIITSLHNAAVIIKNRFENLLGFNSFRNRVEKRLIPEKWGNHQEQFNDEDLLKIAATLQSEYANFPVNTIADAARHVAFQNKFNPAQDRLKELAEEWDGVPRLKSWLVNYLNGELTIENGRYLEELGTRWMIGVAARVLRSGCKRDDVLVLQGEQGFLKSTAAQVIADTIQIDAFSDSISDLNNKDAALGLRGLVICELAELATINRSDVESVKAFVSKRVDKVREPYARMESNYERTVSFIGTTNSENFLVDATGNRRWWPVKITERIDIPSLREVMPQLLGEATRRFLEGEQWHVSDEVALRQAETVRDEHFDHDIWTDRVERTVKNILEQYEHVTIDEVLTRMELPVSQQNKATKNRITAILRQMKFTQERRGSDGARVRVWVPPPKIGKVTSTSLLTSTSPHTTVTHVDAPKPAPHKCTGTQTGKVTSTTPFTSTSPHTTVTHVDAPKPAPHKAASTTSTTSTSFQNIYRKENGGNEDARKENAETSVQHLGMLRKDVDVVDVAPNVDVATVLARPHLFGVVDVVDAPKVVDVKKPLKPIGIEQGISFFGDAFRCASPPRQTCGQCANYDDRYEHHGYCQLFEGEIEPDHVECLRFKFLERGSG